MGKKNHSENNLERNVRPDRARECIFRGSGGTHFKHFPNRYSCFYWPAQKNSG